MYIWQKKQTKKVHIATKKGTECKYENCNSMRKMTEGGDAIPVGRELCLVCEQNSKRVRKSRKGGAGFYGSWEWLKARYETLARYGAVCMCCGSKKRIRVDHIKPRSKYPDLELELDNLQVLCDACNRGKSNNDETDFRPEK